jgi:hypothetical protein
MDDRGANIDIVFRNGLKDFEVLPPPEAWDNIRPVLKVKQKPFLLLRAAALIAVLMTMSFFAYRWSREIPSEPDNYVLALNEEVVSPGIFPSIDQPLKIAVEESIPPVKISKSQIIVI